jgi:SAM-dependent methyltransferase
VTVPVGFDAAWLRLREDADAAARARSLLDPLRRRLASRSGLVVCDLGCGTGAMGRWLAGRLPGPQHWVLFDRDAGLLARATATLPAVAADGTPVTAAARRLDLAALTGHDLAGADLVTASALLDVLSLAEVERLAAACARAGCPVLLTLTVDGYVRLDPADPLDAEIAAASHAHQRRRDGSRRLLGPDAAAAAVEAFARHGARVLVRGSPWRLGRGQSALIRQWLQERVAAACRVRPDLADPATAYLARRLDAADHGRLRVVVGHRDLLAVFD